MHQPLPSPDWDAMGSVWVWTSFLCRLMVQRMLHPPGAEHFMSLHLPTHHLSQQASSTFCCSSIPPACCLDLCAPPRLSCANLTVVNTNKSKVWLYTQGYVGLEHLCKLLITVYKSQHKICISRFHIHCTS